MTDTRVPRLLSACLHQAIVDELPDRLEFYEHWLRSDTLRASAITLASFTAVVGFLRTEGVAYEAVMTRAGVLASQWHLDSVSRMRRRIVHWLPRAWRARSAMKIAAALIASTSGRTRASTQARQRAIRVTVVGSPFCQVRERPTTPLCGFHLAATTETLRCFGVPARGRVERCHAVEEGDCLIVVELLDSVPVADPVVAA